MANDAFLKVFGPDLSGESTDVDHKDWIEVLSYSLGMNQPVSTASGTGGRSAGRVGFSDFSVMKQVDKSSLDLMLHCCKGTHFAKVELQVHEASGEKHQFLVWTLEDVIISSIQPSGSQALTNPWRVWRLTSEGQMDLHAACPRRGGRVEGRARGLGLGDEQAAITRSEGQGHHLPLASQQWYMRPTGYRV